MSRYAPIQISIHPPQTGAGKRELARRMAGIHADHVLRTIRSLNCPVWQQLELLQAVIDTAGGTYAPAVPEAHDEEQTGEPPGG